MKAFGWKRLCVLGLVCGALALSASSTLANVTLVDNVSHIIKVTDYPCPAHGTAYCSSALAPYPLQLLANATDWFKQTLGGAYGGEGSEWKFTYDNAADGVLTVEIYDAYNGCPGLMGAEIKVSSDLDFLWISAYRERWPGTDNSRIDTLSGETMLPGPFYPYQDEDQTSGWNSGTTYDYFYDKPGDPCPKPGTVTSLRFETYLATWDDFFGLDDGGKRIIIDQGEKGHNVKIYAGFAWGYDLHCVPAPAAFVLAFVGVGLVALVRRVRG
jgi:hypothetical protein